MNKQRGGSFQVSGYIALTLLALAVLEAGTIWHLHKHRQLVVNFHPVTDSKSHATKDPDDDYGVVHTFPPKRTVCSGFDTICFNKI